MSIYPRQRLGSLIAEVSERNRTMQCTDVYSVTNRQGFVPSEDYFNKKVFSKDISNYKLVRHEMLAYNPSRINVGSIAYLREKKCVAVSPLYVVFRIKEPALLPAWLEYFLRSEMGRTQIRALTSGSVRDSLKYTALERIEIPRVPLEIQESNLANLTALDRSIAICETLLEKLDELVKSQFVEMFGDLYNNSMNWSLKKFTECATIESNMIHDFTGYENVPHIGIDSIEKNTGALIGYRTVQEDGIISGKYLFTPKHIIYSKIRPNLNKVALPNFEGVCSADSYAILPNEDICNRIFFAHVMRSSIFLDYILPFSNRTNLPKVNRKQVEGFMMPTPPIALQNEFAAFVEQTDKSEFLLRQLLEKQQTLKKALMQEYFS